MGCGSSSRTKVKKVSWTAEDSDKTGEFMRSSMLDMDSRLRVATTVEKDETQASQSVFEILQRWDTQMRPHQPFRMGGAALTRPRLPFID
jgi:hypothetical protein